MHMCLRRIINNPRLTYCCGDVARLSPTHGQKVLQEPKSEKVCSESPSLDNVRLLGFWFMVAPPLIA